MLQFAAHISLELNNTQHTTLHRDNIKQPLRSYQEIKTNTEDDAEVLINSGIPYLKHVYESHAHFVSP